MFDKLIVQIGWNFNTLYVKELLRNYKLRRLGRVKTFRRDSSHQSRLKLVLPSLPYKLQNVGNGSLFLIHYSFVGAVTLHRLPNSIPRVICGKDFGIIFPVIVRRNLAGVIGRRCRFIGMERTTKWKSHLVWVFFLFLGFLNLGGVIWPNKFNILLALHVPFEAKLLQHIIIMLVEWNLLYIGSVIRLIVMNTKRERIVLGNHELQYMWNVIKLYDLPIFRFVGMTEVINVLGLSRIKKLNDVACLTLVIPILCWNWHKTQ